jgi:hypothetical protein
MNIVIHIQECLSLHLHEQHKQLELACVQARKHFGMEYIHTLSAAPCISMSYKQLEPEPF